MGVCISATYHKNNIVHELQVHFTLLLILFVTHLTIFHLHWLHFCSPSICILIQVDIQVGMLFTVAMYWHLQTNLTTSIAAAL